MAGIDWSYFDQFEAVVEKYMPDHGEGETMAQQIVTAVNKLVYKWYNDGDVFDNTHILKGWANDLSSYANWLDDHAAGTSVILHGISGCTNDEDYELLLKNLVDLTLNEDYLRDYTDKPKVESIYECDGPFQFEESTDYDDDDDYYDDEED